MAYLSFLGVYAFRRLDAHTHSLRGGPMPPSTSATLQFLNLGVDTVRVFSDGVPERDYPKGCQLAVPCADKGNYLTVRNQARCASLVRVACRLGSWFGAPPPHLRQRPLTGPHLVQRIALVQPSILHHVPN